MPTDPPDWQKRNQDILKDAFRKAQEEQRGRTAERNVANRVSETIKNHKNNQDFTPKGNLRRSVDRTYSYNKVTVERAKSNEEIRKAQAAAENAKKQAAAKPAPAKDFSKAAGQQKANQQQASAASHKMYDAIAKAKAEITGKQSQVMVKSDFNRASGGREGR